MGNMEKELAGAGVSNEKIKKLALAALFAA